MKDIVSLHEDGKYELHLVFACKADRDLMVQIIKNHLTVINEKVE